MAALFVLGLKSFNLHHNKKILVGGLILGFQLDILAAYFIAKALAPYIHLSF